MRLLLSEILPLRRTSALGDFSEDVALPEVFGDLTDAPFPLIRLSPTRYFAADHPMEVATAFVERQVAEGWEAVLESDAAGNTWTEVRFTAPVPQTSAVWATGRGRRHPLTGDLITNPADVLARATEIAGRGDDWSALRAECSRFGLVAGGRFSSTQSIRAQIDAVASSFAAIWAPGMARLYPSTADPAPILDLAREEVADIAVSASVVDTADVLRLWYDWSDARGGPQRFIELTASPQRQGGIAKEVTYEWLRTPQAAETVGRAVLGRLAAERYGVRMNVARTDVRAGAWVRPIAHPQWPLDGSDPVIMVLSPTIDFAAGASELIGETALSVPEIRVTGFSAALPNTVDAAVLVALANGVATFTILDEDRRPLAGARVALDGSAPRTTDAQGKVSFVAASGTHVLTVEAVGFAPFELTITL